MATLQQRADIFSQAAAAAKLSTRRSLESAAAVVDKTNWLELCPAANPVTEGYVRATPELRALVCARALRQCSGETLGRGGLYPFVIGPNKTNGLLNAVGWLCDKYSACACVTDVCSAEEAGQFAHVGSSAWHLLQLTHLLDSISVNTKCTLVNKAAAHASACGVKQVADDVEALARVAFIQHSHTLPGPPSITMTNEMWAIAAGQPASASSEIASLLPRVVKSAITKHEKQLQRPEHTDTLWQQFAGICALYRAPGGLEFSV